MDSLNDCASRLKTTPQNVKKNNRSGHMGASSYDQISSLSCGGYLKITTYT